MTFFYIFFLFIVFQRLLELAISRSHEKKLKKQGAFEVGIEQYRWIVVIHSLFLISLFCEVVFLNKPPIPGWVFPFIVFLLAQVLRIWAIQSLGVFWNTKVIVLPDTDVVIRGPYRYMRHPNYLIVTIEFMMIPLIFQAYLSLVLFSILNALILFKRIPLEEATLKNATDYSERFEEKGRLLPKL